ncbi:MAG: ABC transporter substrate-binding protein [Methylococcales symbiont of Hymedesmia sp. n. MRB-2018]|nr:MAG: ABC transporter substrate-binding protein [Methylococcales symbiont of Hymedesmia sp. n. MRB-2018]KAF3983287.1 MAG: ABC transporter substrate-binding protein [Methylococcales symbiont of Hymedesmia sp. n. MRB-2018]
MKNKDIKKLFLFSILMFVSTFALVSNVTAAELVAPQVAIETASNKVKEKLQDETFIHDFQQVNAFVDKVINPHVDFKRISALVLGKLWKKATKDEKKQFISEFKTLLVRTYSRAFVGFKDWSVRFLPLNLKQGAKKYIVKTEILQPGIQPVAINYRMVLSKGTWKAYDIMIEGVSLVTNYRTSIKNEFRKTGSIASVIETLAKRNATALAKKDNS